MATVATNDLDYLATRLHARRSRMAEAERLDPLCRLRAIPDLGRALRPEFDFTNAAKLQRQLLQDLVSEFSFCLRHLDGAGAELVGWMRTRFQIENLKVLLRGYLNHVTPQDLEEHLVNLPEELALDVQALLKAETLEAFAKILPAGPLRKLLVAGLATQGELPGSFLFEAALDAGYYRELLKRLEPLAGDEREAIQPLIRQEVEFFFLRLALRGKFNHGLATQALSALRVAGSGAAADRFQSMLAAPDIPAVAKVGLGHAFDELPGPRNSPESGNGMNFALLETLAWSRLLRLANGAFRRSHMGLGAVVGYLEIRRVEVANLISVSEGIRVGMDSEQIRSRLIPRTDLEAAYV